MKLDQSDIKRMFGPVLRRHLWRKPNPRINMAAKVVRLNGLKNDGLCIRSVGRAQHVIGRDRESLSSVKGKPLSAMERSRTFNSTR